jgi:hypothetical protein
MWELLQGRERNECLYSPSGFLVVRRCHQDHSRLLADGDHLETGSLEHLLIVLLPHGSRYRVIFGVGALACVKRWSASAFIVLYSYRHQQGGGTSALDPYYNPRPVDYNGIRQLLENAYWGRL